MKKYLLMTMLLPTIAFATKKPEIELPKTFSNVQSQWQRQSLDNVNTNTNTNTNVNNNSNRSKSYSGSFAKGGNVSGVSARAYGGNGTSSVTGFNGNGGESNSSNTVSTGAVTMNQNQVQQTPFAYSPGLSGSFSQENCANSASLGVSAGFGAIGGGMPIDNDGCNRRRDAQLWAAFGQNRIACERMAQDDDNAEAMKKAGITCAQLVKIVVPVTNNYSNSVLESRAKWDKIEADRNAIFNR